MRKTPAPLKLYVGPDSSDPCTCRGAERARAEAAALVSIPNRGGGYSTSLLPDPDAVPRLRARLAITLERLAGTVNRPRRAELHWYEAHGTGRTKIKIKRFLD